MKIAKSKKVEYDKLPKLDITDKDVIIPEKIFDSKVKDLFVRVNQTPNYLLLYDERNNVIKVRWIETSKDGQEEYENFYNFDLELPSDKSVSDLKLAYPFFNGFKEGDFFINWYPFVYLEWKDGKKEFISISGKEKFPELDFLFSYPYLIGNKYFTVNKHDKELLQLNNVVLVESFFEHHNVELLKKASPNSVIILDRVNFKTLSGVDEDKVLKSLRVSNTLLITNVSYGKNISNAELTKVDFVFEEAKNVDVKSISSLLGSVISPEKAQILWNFVLTKIC
jgi:hypothetical protein